MDNCEYCGLLQRDWQIVASSEDVVIAVKDKVAVLGQITIFPKEHFTIMELVPEPVLQQCLILANKASTAIFETLGSQGTNVLIRNGLGAGQDVPHFGIEVIPRKEDDGLNLRWEPRPLSEDEIEMTQQALLSAIFEAEKGRQAQHNQGADKPILQEKGRTNYLIKSLRRRA
ncbi:MAG TPA: HIT family protein [Candidatus Nanoarchaeia archaeon]|nr:HIT family protein [Candidatus Nanoarchaeia archaeon]